jgi:hypothetical protein
LPAFDAKSPVSGRALVAVAVALFWLVPGRALLGCPQGVVAAVVAASLGVGLGATHAGMQAVSAAVCGLALAALGMLAPAWWAIGAAALVLTLALRSLAFPGLVAARPKVELSLYVGLGVLFPATTLVAIGALGGEASVRAITGEARSFDRETLLLLPTIPVVSTWALGVIELACRRADDARKSVLVRALAAGLAVLFVARLARVVSLASLPLDTITWSESPFLVNMLKLRAGESMYGPMELANSYSYSPGNELVHYALLRPFGLELQLLAHRALAFGWQALATGVLTAALWGPVRGMLQPALGRAAIVLVVAVVGNAIWSTMLGPNVHPDHLGKVCFASALALMIALPRLPRRLVLAGILLLPVAATAFKLTGAGLGVGLVLVMFRERRWNWFGPLVAAAVLAIGTIPLFNFLLGSYSLYAIRLQASHPMEWYRASTLLTRPEGRAFVLAVVLAVVLRHGRRSETTDAAMRVALVTIGAFVPASIAYLKNGGLTNNLVTLTIGATVIMLLLASEISDRIDRPRVAALLACGLCLWMTLRITPPEGPIVGARRAYFLSLHRRSVAWFRDETRLGHHPLLWYGIVPWIDAGRRDVPRDQLTSAVELYLGNWPALDAHVRRLFDGTYDGILLTGAAVWDNPLVGHLRPRLEANYDVVEPPGGPWPPDRDSLVIFARKNAPEGSGSGAR